MVAQASMLDRVFYLLINLPSPEEILAISTTPEENLRLERLAEKKEMGKLTAAEEEEVKEYVLAEKYVRLAKAKAIRRLHNV